MVCRLIIKVSKGETNVEVPFLFVAYSFSRLRWGANRSNFFTCHPSDDPPFCRLDYSRVSSFSAWIDHVYWGNLPVPTTSSNKRTERTGTRT